MMKRLLAVWVLAVLLTGTPVFAADTDAVVVAEGSACYHAAGCPETAGKNAIAVTVQQALVHGYTGCETCHAGVIPHETAASPVFVSFFAAPSAASAVAARESAGHSAPAALMTVPEMAVQGAYDSYVKAGFPKEAALARVMARKAEIIAYPAAIPIFVQADLNNPMIPVERNRFILDLGKRMVHMPDCVHIQEAAQAQRLTTDLPFSQLSAAGFVPCPYCHPELAVISLEQVVQRTYAACLAAGLTKEQAMALILWSR